MDLETTKRVLAALERERVEYVIFGAVALNLQGLARATEDLDIFIAPTTVNVEKLRTALHSVFADPEIDQITADDLLGEYPAVKYVPPAGDWYMDVLTRLGEAWRYADLASTRVDFDGVEVAVVTAETLWRMKRNTVRPKDWGDAARLAERFGFRE
ncbi:MAG: nucleotidyl transferase AbiEii/AbiGii toxin family protein [Thermoanaerobaculia bacterium]